MIQVRQINHETYCQTIRIFLDRLDDKTFNEQITKNPELKKFIKDTNYQRKEPAK